MEIIANNVNVAYSAALHWLRTAGVRETSRNGPVIVSPEPVLTTYLHPRERVLFSPLRDANPFLHFFEALWMLAGRNDVTFPAQFAPQMLKYSDDGKTLHGAYGCRWRKWFGYDQLSQLAMELKSNPDTRRAVLTMWDGGAYSYEANNQDFGEYGDLRQAISGGKDVPCNTHAYLDCRGGKLNLTVVQRSGDAVWGTFGANAAHFSVLQEFLAAWVGVPVGVYRHFTNNLHLYPEVFKTDLFAAAEDAEAHNYYPCYIKDKGKPAEPVEPYPLVSVPIADWEEDLRQFLKEPLNDDYNYNDKFFSTVAYPMYAAWAERKTKQGTGLEWAGKIAAFDWRVACEEWIHRREARKNVQLSESVG